MTTIPVKSYGADVASYQPSSVASYVKLGAKFIFTKISQSTNYVNPSAKAQIKSTKANGAMPMAYFYANFCGNSAVARAETNYAIKNAKVLGIPDGSYFAVDWENNGGNSIYGDVTNNTNAVITAMEVLKEAGYKPLLYSGADALRNRLQVSKVIKKFGTCIWVASYATMNAVSKANFNYFPSMDGVAIWQFTSNWHGMKVDANINLITLTTGKSAKKKPAATKAKSEKHSNDELNIHPAIKWNIERVFIVSNKKGANLYSDKELTKPIALKKFNTVWQVFDEKDGAIQVAKNAYFDGRAGVTKSNPIAFNDNKHAVVKVMLPHTHALKSPDANAEKAYALEEGKKYEVVGRKGRFLLLKTENGSKRYVTGNRAFVVL